jgi:solute carrier family 25 S-adenosylmethionine transporter 26
MGSRTSFKSTVWALLVTLQLVHCISSESRRVGNSRRVVAAPSTEQLVSSPSRRLAVVAILGSATIVGRIPKNEENTSNRELLEDDWNGLTAAEQLLADEQTSSSTAPVAYDPLVSIIAGSALTTSSTLVRYPLDTATVRLQTSTDPDEDLFRDCWAGVTTPLLANIPAGAVFFLTKDAIANWLTLQDSVHMSSFLVTTIAVAVAQVPNWIIKNPSEVIKTQQQAGTSNSASLDELQSIQDNVTYYYQGFGSNLRYNYPADMIKFCLYEQLHTIVHPGIAGAIAAVVAQILTTPLDVVRNREMALTSGSDDETNLLEGGGSIWAGTTTRVAKAIVSGGVQFAALEKTQDVVAAWLKHHHG